MSNLNTETISILNGEVISFPANFGTIGIIISGTWSGTLTFQGSLDGISFVNILAQNIGTSTLTFTTTVNGQFLINPSGMTAIKIKMTSYSSGDANIIVQGSGAISIIKSLATMLGGTDAAKIGNTGDRLKVEANLTETAVANAAAFTSKTRAVILTSTILLSTGVYTDVYNYSGSGLLYGFNVEFNNVNVLFRFKIDGEIIFDGVTIATLNSLLVTANNTARRQSGSGIVTSSSTIDWSLKQPIKYNSNITISADANGGVLFSRTFNQGIIYLSKET